jgi:maleylacetate reductase
MLPHVLRWNHSVNADRQAAISAALGEPGADAGDVVARLVERLGLPNRLRDAGVAREQFAEIADHAFHDPWTEANPRRLRDAREIVDLLEKAW